MKQTNVFLPELPEFAPEFRPRWPGDDGGFSAEQMRAYAKAAVEAEREACAKICDYYGEQATFMAAEVIRYRARLEKHDSCPECGATPILRGTGWPGMDDDELDCPKCGAHWCDGSDE